jgi:glyceraldehyde 3-phosphate dehydrogenase
MSIKVGINGFGRIGRLVFREIEADPDLEVVAVNDLGDIKAMAHLLKYDSIHGRVFQDVEVSGDGILVDGHQVQFFNQENPALLPWKELGVEVAIESTGLFSDISKAHMHIEAGAKKVIITGPANNADITLVLGVNDQEYDPAKHHVISNASCTTNCLAPVAKVLLDNFGIERGLMNTIHSYTNDQNVLDLSHKDLRRARSAALSQIPTTTGAARAVSLVLPELEGKLDGMATRVPTPDGSMVDLVVELGQNVTADQINQAMEAAAQGSLKGILECVTDPIVSFDVIGNRHSAVFDVGLTTVLGKAGNFARCVAWYDNELAYSARVKDLIKTVLSPHLETNEPHYIML